MTRRHPRPAGSRTARWAPRRTGQSGVSLIIVLALVAFLGILLPAVLGLVLTGSLVTTPVVEDRQELYAATSAIDAAIELGSADPDVGVPGGPCPTQTLDIEGLEVTVTCEQHAPPLDGCFYLDRFVTYVAEAREPGGTDVLATAYAEAVYRFDLGGSPQVEVRRWTSDDAAASSLTTTTLPPCTPTTTVASTSTTVPVPGVNASWEDLRAEVPGPGNQWRAEGTVVVTDQGAGLEDVDVTVRVEAFVDGVWQVDADRLVFPTTASGKVTFYSPTFKRNGGGSASHIRLVVEAVDSPGWTPAPALDPPPDPTDPNVVLPDSVTVAAP